MSGHNSLIFKKMTNHSSDLIFAMNDEFKLQEVNEASGRILDYDPQELKNGRLIDLVEKEELFFVLQSIEKSKSDGKEVRFQTRFLPKNKKAVLMELSVYWDREDKLYYCTARDLSNRTEAAVAINEYEESFHYLFMENPSPMLIWDFTTLKFVECNTETLKLYGYTREEFLQLSITDIRPPEDIPLILEASKNEQAYRNIKKRWRHLKKNGEVMCMEIKSSIINFRGSRSALVHLNDITAKVNAEEELFRTYRKVSDYKFALDESSIVAITDTNGTITYVNDNFCKVSKYSRQELIGRDHRIVNSGFHDKEFFAGLWNTIKKGEVWRGEIKNKSKDGDHYWVDATIVPFLDEEDKPYQYMAVRFDITAKKKSEENIIIKTKLLSAIANVISVLFQYDDWEIALANSFNIVGEAIAVDRVYYFENYFDLETNKGYANQKLEWTAYKADPQLNNPELQNLPFEVIADFIVPLREMKPFKAIVSQMPESNTKDILLSQEIKSILVLPIFLQDSFYGFIGFDDCRKEREWREDEVSFLKTLTSKLASAIEKRQNVLALEDALKEKSHILESIGEAFFAVDTQWVVTYWNQKAEKILNTKSADILGKNLWSIYKEEMVSSFYREYNRSMTQNVPSHFEVFFDSLSIWLEVSCYPSPSGLSIFFKDISERKINEEKLKKINKELALSNSELEQFAFVASHDLQEPLRMITSFLAQLEKKYNSLLDEKGKRYIHFASDGAKRMRNIILDLLEFSRVGKTDENKQTVNIEELLEEVMGLNRKLIQEKRAQISWQEELPSVYTFRSPLRLLFQNLINNALKYQAEGARPEIDISFEESDSNWRFTVADNGIGIDPEYFDKIFTIFQRLHNKDVYSGTGVGLAICKKIIENLDGEIWVTSEIGKGSQFHFILPK